MTQKKFYFTPATFHLNKKLQSEKVGRVILPVIQIECRKYVAQGKSS